VRAFLLLPAVRGGARSDGHLRQSRADGGGRVVAHSSYIYAHGDRFLGVWPIRVAVASPRFLGPGIDGAR
jgi:hypothetical protein